MYKCIHVHIKQCTFVIAVRTQTCTLNTRGHVHVRAQVYRKLLHMKDIYVNDLIWLSLIILGYTPCTCQAARHSNTLNPLASIFCDTYCTQPYADKH